MKALDSLHTNPTNFFFQQSQNASNEHLKEIEKLVGSLIDLKKCILCRENYNFTNRIPRILIHCGHTFCTSCLIQFYRNFRIRCPICLKLIRNIEFIEQLPMNHTIMKSLANQENQALEKEGKGNEGSALFAFLSFFFLEKINMEEILYTTFMQNNTQQGQQQVDLLVNQVPQDMIKQFMDQQIQLREQELQLLACRAQESSNMIGPMNDPSLLLTQVQEQVTGQFLKQKVFSMEYCEYHYERYKHFHCVAHNLQCCRICCQSVHNKDECIIIDLYDVEDVNYFLQQATLLNAYTDVFNKLTNTTEQPIGIINNLQANAIVSEQQQQQQQQLQMMDKHDGFQQWQQLKQTFEGNGQEIDDDDDDDEEEDEGKIEGNVKKMSI